MRKNIKPSCEVIQIALVLMMTIVTINCCEAQVAPTDGKKQLEVIEKWEGEYDAEISNFYNVGPVLDSHLKKLPKKLEKYGFTNVVIISLGKVVAPDNWATKLHKAQGGNQGAAMSNMQNATSVAGAVAAAELYNAPETPTINTRVHFTSDQGEFKVRTAIMSSNPKYIVKENKMNMKMSTSVASN